jgi:hypothetical protein
MTRGNEGSEGSDLYSSIPHMRFFTIVTVIVITATIIATHIIPYYNTNLDCS